MIQQMTVNYKDEGRFPGRPSLGLLELYLRNVEWRDTPLPVPAPTKPRPQPSTRPPPRASWPRPPELRDLGKSQTGGEENASSLLSDLLSARCQRS